MNTLFIRIEIEKFLWNIVIVKKTIYKLILNWRQIKYFTYYTFKLMKNYKLLFYTINESMKN